VLIADATPGLSSVISFCIQCASSCVWSSHAVLCNQFNQLSVNRSLYYYVPESWPDSWPT